MTRFSILVLLSLAITATGCDNVLDVKPTSEITVNSFWNGPDDATGALYGMYARFRDQASSNLYIWGAARSEELSFGLQASEGRERYFLNTLDATFAGPDWLRLYTVVHDANLLLKYVPGIDFNSEAQKNSILAQAHAMRAYVYFIMARTWGGVPIVTEPTEEYDPEKTFRPRNSVSEVFDLIKEDIEAALSLFPDNGFPACRCEWSKPAVEALKGDVYLWTAKRLGGGNADLNTALAALLNAQSADVGLLENYDEIFRYSNKGNREILMAVHFRDLESGETYNNLMYVRDDQIPENATEYGRNLIGTGGGLNRWAPSELLRNQFTEDDQRKNATFVELYTLTENGDSTFYASAVRKFRGFVESGSRKFLDDVILYRYADVLLMIAEAKNGLGQDPAPEINQVRQRAYGDAFPAHEFVSGSQADNDDAILQERLLELSFEGKRWWDLVRFGKAFELVPSLQGREGQEHLLLWPISQTTISLNPSIEQNPGY
ncbi:RagB/SusD family nutrient uptake outer membrane protein [Rhodocaloribacter litoris]|uniref:RagB/SusD family nutrient uptake outer membrane protein n=1 Tax=Rhodocaloribacter litoris TaxID=2558931 RepID=UPI0014249172|nr:RagB/SusD family nutrient uptake outer membrane protein [Rhodocaloribacter litoris]QXD15093.1 RagB/SusD family nutrient uptake outer membrane protein [Rhodocaloribacter litoris]GIV62116.1 MAG: membrane protein [Rhodothermaceae bacterium]